MIAVRLLVYTALAATFLVAATAPVHAADRPKVGLALSGGGARGAAHIGVLQQLEAHHIPVDCVAGTSMGAVVGGLYAAGFSADEIETLFRELDWSSGFRDKPQRSDLTYRRKQDDRRYLVDFDLGFHNGEFHLPRGLLAGQNLNLVLKHMVARAGNVQNFDELAVPFRAVAADLETGESVVIAKGDLANAVHASMSIPGVYAPVERDGRLLVDGGVADNLPIKVVRDLCADIVIAVDASSPLLTREELGSVVDVIDQLSTILTRRNSDQSIQLLSQNDLLIRPDLSGIVASDFSKITDSIERGRTAAQAMPVSLDSIVARTGPRAPLHHVEPISAPRVNAITVNNESGLSTDLILARLRQPLGAPLDQFALHQDLADLYGTGQFGALNYQLNGDEENVSLQLDMPENPVGPHYFRFGVELEENFTGDSLYNLGMRHTYMPANELGGEWRNEMQMGDNPRVFSEWFQPTSLDGDWFVGASGEWERRRVAIINTESGHRVAEFQYSGWEARTNVGYQFGSDGHSLIGIRTGNGELSERIGDTGLLLPNLGVGEAYIELGLDKLDHRYFPRKGRAGTASYGRGTDTLGADAPYTKWTVDWLQVGSRDRHTYGLQILAGSFITEEAPLQEQFQLGGFQRLSGLSKNELIGPHMRFVNVFYRYRLDNDISATLDTPVYFGSTLEWGNTWAQTSDISAADGIVAASLYLGVDTTFGPLYLAWGHANEGSDSLYLFLGNPF